MKDCNKLLLSELKDLYDAEHGCRTADKQFE